MAEAEGSVAALAAVAAALAADLEVAAAADSAEAVATAGDSAEAEAALEAVDLEAAETGASGTSRESSQVKNG